MVQFQQRSTRAPSASALSGIKSTEGLRGGRPFDTTGPPPLFYVNALRGFQLKELLGGRTRLVVSGYAAAPPSFLQMIAEFFFCEPEYWIMQTRQFANLKKRAERQATTRGKDSRPLSFRLRSQAASS
jgi:proline iminopeptidase